MARIDIKSNGTGGGGGSGTVTSVGLTSSTLTVSGSPVTTSGAFVANIPDGYLKVGTGITGSLQNVVDTNGTATTLFLSSTAAQFTSPLRITTSDASGFYLDAEDSSTNNRFSIKRDPSSQEVTLDFASNPAGSTTLVGAIRTYQDGVNLSNAMSFIEDGSVGIGTNTPVGILHIKKTAANTRLAIDGDAGFNKLISYRTAGLQRFGLYVNNTAESGSNVGSDFAIRAYNDAGTLITTPLFIKRSTGFLGVGNVTAPTQQLHVNGSLRIETGGIYDGTNSIGTSGQVLSSTGTSTAWITPSGGGGTPAGSTGAVQFNNAGAFGADSTNFFWDDTNNRLGIGTNTPTSPLQVAGTITTQNLLSSGVIYGGSFWLQDNGTMALGQQSAGAGKLFIKGSGSTSATTSLLVQNSSAATALEVKDNLTVGMGGAYVNGASGFGATIASITASYPCFLMNSTGGGGSKIGFNMDSAKLYFSEETNGSTLFGHRIMADTRVGGLVVKNDTAAGATASLNSSACLQADSTTRGFLTPRMTNAQRLAIASPAIGLEVYCTDAVEGKYIYKSTGWTFVI